MKVQFKFKVFKITHNLFYILINIGREVVQVHMAFKRHSHDDPRRYNVPKIGEIAVVFSGENGLPPENRDFEVFPKETSANRTTLLNLLSQNTDPMTYPLLFMRGEPGWRPGMVHDSENRYKVNINFNFNFIYFIPVTYNLKYSKKKTINDASILFLLLGH